MDWENISVSSYFVHSCRADGKQVALPKISRTLYTRLQHLRNFREATRRRTRNHTHCSAFA